MLLHVRKVKAQWTTDGSYLKITHSLLGLVSRAAESTTEDINSTTGACGGLFFRSDVTRVDHAIDVQITSHNDMGEDVLGGVVVVCKVWIISTLCVSFFYNPRS